MNGDNLYAILNASMLIGFADYISPRFFIMYFLQDGVTLVVYCIIICLRELISLNLTLQMIDDVYMFDLERTDPVFCHMKDFDWHVLIGAFLYLHEV